MFIVFEGLDGAGTTTQTSLLAQKLRDRRQRVITTFEPSSGPFGVTIRQALQKRLLQPDGQPIDPVALALLFAADRIDHIRSTIEPALRQGATVISDRYVHSSLAYQGATMDPRWVDAINAQARTADLVIWLDVPVDLCWERVASRGQALELFEARATLEAVQRRYEEAIRLRPERVVRVDGSGTIDDVAARVWAVVEGIQNADDTTRSA